MAAIMMEEEGGKPVPMECIKSLTIVSFIKAVNTNVMKVIRKKMQEDAKSDDEDELYGTTDIHENLVNNTKEIYVNDKDGYWIVQTETENMYELQVYKYVVSKGYLYDSRYLTPLFSMYYAQCPITIPRLFRIPPTEGEVKYQKFTDELKSAVSGLRDRAEKGVSERIQDEIQKIQLDK